MRPLTIHGDAWDVQRWRASALDNGSRHPRPGRCTSPRRRRRVAQILQTRTTRTHATRPAHTDTACASCASYAADSAALPPACDRSRTPPSRLARYPIQQRGPMYRGSYTHAFSWRSGKKIFVPSRTISLAKSATTSKISTSRPPLASDGYETWQRCARARFASIAAACNSAQPARSSESSRRLSRHPVARHDTASPVRRVKTRNTTGDAYTAHTRHSRYGRDTNAGGTGSAKYGIVPRPPVAAPLARRHRVRTA